MENMTWVFMIYTSDTYWTGSADHYLLPYDNFQLYDEFHKKIWVALFNSFLAHFTPTSEI